MTEEVEDEYSKIKKAVCLAVANDRAIRWDYVSTLGEDAVDWILDMMKESNLIADVEAALVSLSELDVLFPPGGVTCTEYGLEQSNGILMIGTGAQAQKHATHQREHTAWIDEGPNDYWARYITTWKKIK